MNDLKRHFLFILSVLSMIFLFCGCNSHGDAENNPEASEETTGYESKTIQFQTVMIDDTLYVYGGEGWLSEIPESYEFYGEIKEEDNQDYPSQELCSSRIPVGQKVFVNRDNYGFIYVQNEDGTYGKYYPDN